MAQLAVVCPLREADLGDELGPHPVGGLVALDGGGKRRLLRLTRFQQLRHPFELVLIESRSGMSDVHERRLARRASADDSRAPSAERRAPFLVYAEQERPEVLPRIARLGPAADDEFLLVMDLELAPRGAAAARLVGRPRLLDDQPFPPFLLRARVQRAAIVGHLFADANRARRRATEQTLEVRAALDERQAAQILFPLPQDVERDERDRVFAIDALDIFRVAQVNPALQPLESDGIALRVERNNLAVDDEWLRRTERGERGHDGRELRGLVVAEARPHTHVCRRTRRSSLTKLALARGLYFNQCANAVVLRFEDESGSGERRIGKRREHRSRRARFSRQITKEKREEGTVDYRVFGD